MRGGVPDLSVLDFFGDSTSSTSVHGSTATTGRARKRSKPNAEAEPETEQLLPQAKHSKRRTGIKKGVVECAMQSPLQ